MEDQLKAAPKPPMTAAEQFQVELNELLAKYPTIKLTIEQKITITEKQ